jgi:hypothetical protein
MEVTMRTTVAAIVLIAAVAASGDVWAMCGGGGMVRGGRGMGGVRSSGGVRVAGGGSGSDSKQSKKSITKAEMPAACDIARFDESTYERILSSLKLSEEQMKKINAAKSEIIQAAKQLDREQSDARTAYAKAETEKAYQEAAQKIMAVMYTCKDFQPNKKFDVVLNSVLTPEQRSKYRELSKKS